MPPKKRAALAKKAPPAKKAVRAQPALPARAFALLTPAGRSVNWSQKTAPKKAASKKKATSAAASTADPLAGSAEWDPDTVTPDLTNLGTKLTGKVALITGSGRGLGRAFAERLAALGCKIVIQGRNEAGPAQYGEGTTLTAVADAVAKRYKVPTMRALADLTQADQVDKMMKAILKKFGTIDILVHNAGGDVAKMGGKPKPNSEYAILTHDSLHRGCFARLESCQLTAPVRLSVCAAYRRDRHS